MSKIPMTMTVSSDANKDDYRTWMAMPTMADGLLKSTEQAYQKVQLNSIKHKIYNLITSHRVRGVRNNQHFFLPIRVHNLEVLWCKKDKEIKASVRQGSMVATKKINKQHKQTVKGRMQNQKHGNSMVVTPVSAKDGAKRDRVVDVDMTEDNGFKKVKMSAFGDMEVDVENIPTVEWLSTKPNMTKFNLSMQLDEDDAILGATAFKGLIDEEIPADDRVHNAVQRIYKMIIKLISGNKNALETDPDFLKGMDTNTWVKCFASIVKNDYDDEIATSLIGEDGMTKIKICILRLANTPPTIIWSAQELQGQKVQGNKFSRAWYAAVQTIGSHYKKQQKVQMKIQQKLSFAPKNANEKTVEKVASKANSAKEKPKPADSDDTPMIVEKEPASQAKIQTKLAPPKIPENKVRLIVKFTIDTPKGKSPSEVVRRKIMEQLKTYKMDDKEVAIVPWKMSGTGKPIREDDDFPDKLQEFSSTYSDRIRVRSKGTVWFKLRVATNLSPESLTSVGDSITKYWFEDNAAGAFLCTVQESDNTVDLGDMLYSGPFIDNVRLTKVVKELYKAWYKEDLLAGCRPKKNTEIPVDKESTNTNWTLAENQPIHFEVHEPQAQNLKRLLYQTFNKVTNPEGRPGGYGFQFLPVKTMMMTGTDGIKARIRAQSKHKAVIKSLVLIKNISIRSLDKVVKERGSTTTLRKEILKITYPIDSAHIANPPKLFHTVDCAPSGSDCDQGVVYLTAYKDRARLAAGVSEVLPAYIQTMFSDNAMHEWFTPVGIASCEGVNLEINEDGAWNGKWTTPEDELQDAMWHEELGVQLQITNLELLDEHEDDGLMYLTADDASRQSFGADMFGRPGRANVAGQRQTQQTGSATSAGSRTADSVEGDRGLAA